MSNPAARLHSILTRAKAVTPQAQMAVGWRQVLELADEVDDLTVMNRVGRVFTLPDVVVKEIQRFNDLDADLYLGWRKDLAEAFRHVGFQFQFQEFSKRLSDSLLINIRFCAHELEKRLPEREIPREELEQIRNSVWELYDAVLKSELPPLLFRYALDHLYLIVEAIDNYSVTGASGLEIGLNEVIGATITEKTASEGLAKSEVGEKFWKTMGRIAVALKLGKSALELADAAHKALTHTSG